MAIPAYRAKGTSNSGLTTTNPGLPAGIEVGDLLIHFVASAGTVTEGEATNVPTAEAGWTELLSEKKGNTRLTIFYQIATTTTPNHKVTGAAVNHLTSNIIAIKKATFNEATPFHKKEISTQAKTKSVSYPTTTTTQAECLIVNISSASLPKAPSETEFGAPTNASLAELTERVDNSTAEGDGSAVNVVTGTKAVAGAVSATTSTAVTEAERVVVTLAIAPVGAGGPKELNLADSVTISAEISKQPAKGLADSVTITGLISKQPAKSLADSVTVSAALSKLPMKGLSDIVVISGAMSSELLKARGIYVREEGKWIFVSTRMF